MVPDDLIGRHELPDVPDDLVRHLHIAEPHLGVAEGAPFPDVDDLDVRDVACLRVEVGVGLGDHRHAIGEVQLLDQELLPLMQVHRSGMQRAERSVLVGGAEQLAGPPEHDPVHVARSRADVDLAVG